MNPLDASLSSCSLELELQFLDAAIRRMEMAQRYELLPECAAGSVRPSRSALPLAIGTSLKYV